MITGRWPITSRQDHPFHLHLAHFQVLGRGRDLLGLGGAGDQRGPDDAGWKDTTYIPNL